MPRRDMPRSLQGSEEDRGATEGVHQPKQPAGTIRQGLDGAGFQQVWLLA